MDVNFFRKPDSTEVFVAQQIAPGVGMGVAPEFGWIA